MHPASIIPIIPTQSFSLAAATDAERQKSRWSVQIPERGRIEGRVEHRYAEDELLFVIDEVVEEQLGLRMTAWVAAWSGDNEAPVTSQPFHPTIDQTVIIGRDLGVFPREIRRLELRLTDEA
jgi:hypothetical protein